MRRRADEILKRRVKGLAFDFRSGGLFLTLFIGCGLFVAPAAKFFKFPYDQILPVGTNHEKCWGAWRAIFIYTGMPHGLRMTPHAGIS
jgi:hypothetical protein